MHGQSVAAETTARPKPPPADTPESPDKARPANEADTPAKDHSPAEQPTGSNSRSSAHSPEPEHIARGEDRPAGGGPTKNETGSNRSSPARA